MSRKLRTPAAAYKLRIRSDRGSLVRTSRVIGNFQLLRIVLGAQIGQDPWEEEQETRSPLVRV